MLLDEIGSPVLFELKEILYHSQKMKNNDYPYSIFYFNKKNYGKCNFRIDTEQEVFCISILILDDLFVKFKCDPDFIEESIIELIEQDFKEYRDFKLVPMSDWELEHYDVKYEKNKFIKF